jgi:putative transposase
MKRAIIDPSDTALSLSSQCEITGLPRSTFYYSPVGESELNLKLMRLLDEQYTKTPFYGVPKMTEYLNEIGYCVNEKRVRRLLRLMGLEAIYEKPKTSVPNIENRVYPYLLKGLTIDRPNQVWASDITYIRLERGFAYLVAMLDWYSRYVLSWELSISLDSGFCVSALEKALSSAQPEIFNTDQGSQFTSVAFTGVLKTAGVGISMDGRGRCYDNIMVERLWRSVKYETVYLKNYRTVWEAQDDLEMYFDFYNEERYHASLDYKRPADVYRRAV